MKALDTNIIIRFLVHDDKRQLEKAELLLNTAEKQGEVFFVSLLVVQECIWVLDSSYNASRDEILDALDQLMRLDCLEFESPDVVRSLVIEGKNGKAELSDMLIGLASRHRDAGPVLTFDKKAVRQSDLFQAL